MREHLRAYVQDEVVFRVRLAGWRRHLRSVEVDAISSLFHKAGYEIVHDTRTGVVGLDSTNANAVLLAVVGGMS